MQLNRCPICHTRISLDALAQDEAGRELLGILSKLDTDAGTALVGYLSLFRAQTRDLANDRALRLAKESLALSESLPALAEAMRITVEQIRAKGGDALSNHRYLQKVLGDYRDVKPYSDGKAVLVAEPYKAKPVGKTAQALQALEDFGNGNG